MYIFRWLMKHPIIILALYFLSIVAILYSMTGGGSSDIAKDEATKVNIAEVDLSDAPSIEPSTLTSALVTGDSSEEKTEAIKTVTTNDTDTKTVAEPTTTPADEETTETISPSDEATTETATSSDVAIEEPTEIEDAKAADTQFSEMSTQELLLMAREAYWNNGLDESAEIYQQLIGLNPEVIDYKGELGNVYWRQGFPKKAAELYAEISLPMINEGDTDKVANMVGFIGLFFPEKATEIHNILEAAK